MRLRWVLPILKHEAYLSFMKTVNNTLGFSASDTAQFRLRCIKILKAHGYTGIKLAFPKVSRRSVFRWQKQYQDSDGRLTSLIPASTRPHRLRQMVIPAAVLSFIKAMREQHPKLSKYKLKIFLEEILDQVGYQIHTISNG